MWERGKIRERVCECVRVFVYASTQFVELYRANNILALYKIDGALPRKRAPTRKNEKEKKITDGGSSSARRTRAIECRVES